MNIQGLQKLTLLDYPDKLAATVFTGGCNFRCPFCHNAPLVTGPSGPGLDEREVLAYLEKRRGMLQAVCISGGEPTVLPALPGFLRRVRALGYAVKLDTNGSRPAVLRELVAAGLVDYVAMDIKNSPARYAETVGLPGFDVSPILESAALLMAGAVEYEFRTTVVREFHTAAAFDEIGEWLAGARLYYLQRFVDSGNLIRPGLTGYSDEELAAFTARLRAYIPQTLLRGV